MDINSKEYSVGIIGWGIVGKGIHRLFRESVIALYDPFVNELQFVEWLEKEGIADTNIEINGKQEFHRCDMAVVAVPTPMAEDGSCDTSYIGETLDWLKELHFDGVVLVKSAVVPSEVNRFLNLYPTLRIVISPEYMGESKYYTPPWKYPDPTDMKSHTWQVFGGKSKDTSECVSIFQRKMGVDVTYFQVDPLTAALTKYAENCFFAVKVTFCNELYDICEKYGVDYNTLREAWAFDPRVNKNHTLVFPRDRGYGGRCYPKDMNGLINDCKKMGYEPELLKAADKINTKFRKKNEE